MVEQLGGGFYTPDGVTAFGTHGHAEVQLPHPDLRFYTPDGVTAFGTPDRPRLEVGGCFYTPDGVTAFGTLPAQTVP